MCGDLKTPVDGNGAPSVSALDSAGYSRHRWYFFKEGFSPAIVDHAIEDAGLQDGSLVLDPFCGSGTVPLEAALKGFRGHGIEVNPFLAFVARTKLLSSVRPERSTLRCRRRSPAPSQGSGPPWRGFPHSRGSGTRRNGCSTSRFCARLRAVGSLLRRTKDRRPTW